MFNELTEVDIKKMEEEIDYRNNVLRPQLLENLKDARELGDLSENAEYHIAKREKNKNESRVRYLQRMIRTAKIITTNPDKDKIGIFDKVGLYFEDDDETVEYTISTTLRRNPSENIISKECPLGKAIMDKKVGDRVEVFVSNEVKYFVVIKYIIKGEDDDSLPITKYWKLFTMLT